MDDSILGDKTEPWVGIRREKRRQAFAVTICIDVGAKGNSTTRRRLRGGLGCGNRFPFEERILRAEVDRQAARPAAARGVGAGQPHRHAASAQLSQHPTSGVIRAKLPAPFSKSGARQMHAASYPKAASAGGSAPYAARYSLAIGDALGGPRGIRRRRRENHRNEFGFKLAGQRILRLVLGEEKRTLSPEAVI